MFKYNRCIIPFVVLFVICSLFYSINKNNLTYNISPEYQHSVVDINTCNKQPKKLKIIPSRKGNNSKIIDYIFENNQIKENYITIDDDNNNMHTSMLLDSQNIKEIKTVLNEKKDQVLLKNDIEKQKMKSKLKTLESGKMILKEEIKMLKMKKLSHMFEQSPPVEQAAVEPLDVKPSTVAESDKYFMLKNVSDTGISVISTTEKLAECSNMSVKDAIVACDNAPDDCNGFYNYDSDRVSRTCFKSDIDTTQPQRHVDKTIYPNAAFYYKKP
jgi:hypothetical protein